MHNKYKKERYSNYKGLETENNNKKIILNNKNDLINIPIQQLRTAQLKNFCGNLFDKIYEEAMIIEHNQDNKIPNKAFSQELNYKKYNTINLSNDILGNIPKKFDKNYKKRQNKRNIERQPEKNQKSTSTETKKVIKIIKKKVAKKFLTESSFDMKKNQKPNIINNSIIFKKMYNNYINLNMNKHNDLNINKIFFSIKYDTKYGEEVGILGSIPKLGNWNQNKIFNLNWNNGNIWTGDISLGTDSLLDFEFKFVISTNRKVKRWENGDNNKVVFDKLLKYKKNGIFNKYEYSYDSNKEELYLKCKWD